MVLAYGWTSFDPTTYGSAAGSDPLGLRAWGERVARRLVPVFTGAHDSMWGFLFACGCHRLSTERQRVETSEAFVRGEALWVHAQIRKSGTSPAPSWTGARVAARMAGQDAVDLRVPLVRRPLTQGAWGRYRRPAYRLDLFWPQEDYLGNVVRVAFTPEGAVRTAAGTRLANVFLNVLGADTAPQWRRAVKDATADRSVLGAVPLATRTTVPEDATRLLESQLRSALPEGDRERLAALRRCFDCDPDAFPDPARLPSDLLTEKQREARSSAVAVLRLVERVELPYRAWLTGEDQPPPAPSVWKDPAWEVASADGEQDVRQLRERGRFERGSWTGVDGWQRELARHRGSRPWERGEPPSSYASTRMPGFALSGLQQLFAEGLLGDREDEAWWRSRRPGVDPDEDLGTDSAEGTTDE